MTFCKFAHALHNQCQITIALKTTRHTILGRARSTLRFDCNHFFVPVLIIISTAFIKAMCRVCVQDSFCIQCTIKFPFESFRNCSQGAKRRFKRREKQGDWIACFDLDFISLFLNITSLDRFVSIRKLHIMRARSFNKLYHLTRWSDDHRIYIWYFKDTFFCLSLN